MKNPFLQQFQQPLSAHALAERSQNLGAGRIVVKQRPRLMGAIPAKEGCRPVPVHPLPVRGAPVACGHAQHILNGHAQQPWVWRRRQHLGKEVHNVIRQAQPPLPQKQSQGQRHHALADGIHPMGLPLGKGRIIALRPDFAILPQFEAVKAHVFPLQAFHKAQHGFR